MTLNIKSNPTIIRTERGLTISGTRITLYQIMDFLKAGYSHEEIINFFRLTINQMTNILSYIETNQNEVEAEYQHVLALAESNRQYWEERNRERFAQISQMPPKPEYAELWRKLQAWKAHPNSAE
jgi:uncharacterized protein (DUF433 family)